MMFLFSNVKNLGFFTEKGQEFHRLDPCGANHPTRLLLHGAANSAVAKHFFMFSGNRRHHQTVGCRHMGETKGCKV